jgi:hypothetical protein
LSIKSVLLGFGLGIIFTAIIGLVYSKGDNSVEDNLDKYDNSINDTFVLTEDSEEEKNVSKKDKIVDNNENENENENNNKSNGENITLIIDSGDTSSDVAKKLKKLRIIKDINEFETLIIDMNREKYIKVGEFKIKNSDNLNQIIDKITN